MHPFSVDEPPNLMDNTMFVMKVLPKEGLAFLTILQYVQGIGAPKALRDVFW
jgi:hypothetical protein